MAFSLGGVVGSVTIESALAPAITIDLGGGSDDGSGGGGDGGAPSQAPLLLRLLSLRITAPNLNVHYQPAGDPPTFPWLGFTLGIAALGITALAVFGAVKLAEDL